MSRAMAFLKSSENEALLAATLNSPGHAQEGGTIGLTDDIIGEWNSACTKILKDHQYTGGPIGRLVKNYNNENMGILYDTQTWTENAAGRLLDSYAASVRN